MMNKKFSEEMQVILSQIKADLEKSLEDVAQKSNRVENAYEAKFPEYGTSEEEGADEEPDNGLEPQSRPSHPVFDLCRYGISIEHRTDIIPAQRSK